MYMITYIKKESSFSYVPKESKEQGRFKCTFKFGNEDIKHFDIKQLICHFLGISAALIDNADNRLESNNIRFIYLVFNPKSNADFSNDAIKNYEKKLKDQYDETIKEIEKFGNMKWLFGSILDFQLNENKNFEFNKKNLSLPVVDYSFDFKLMDQEEYKKYLAKISCQTPLQI